jgi:hypothetical protein
MLLVEMLKYMASTSISSTHPSPISLTFVSSSALLPVGTVFYMLLRMRSLSISWAEGFVVISCGKVDYDKSGWRDD